MENSSINGTVDPVATESKAPLFIAVAALVLGGLSFVFSFNTKSNLTRYKEASAKEVAEAAEAAKQAAADARSAGGNGGAFTALEAEFKSFKADFAAKYAQIARSQEQVVQNARSVNDRLTRLEGNAPRSATASAPARGNASGPAAATTASSSSSSSSASGGKYVVKKGDYPAKIAKELGITTEALLRANPGLDPKRLQIGQELNLPAGR